MFLFFTCDCHALYFFHVTGKGPLLPTGTIGFVRNPPDQPLTGSGSSGIPGSPTGSGLMLPPECPPLGPGGSNIPGVPVLPRGLFGPGAPGAPVPRAISPHHGVSVPGGQVVVGGRVHPPVHLPGAGGLRVPRPLLDTTTVVGHPRPQVCDHNNIHVDRLMRGVYIVW